MDKNVFHSDTQKQNHLDRNIKVGSINLSQSSETIHDFSDTSCNNLRRRGNDSSQYDEVTTETQHNQVDVAEAETGSTFSIPVDSSNKSLSCSHNECKFPINQMDDYMQRFAPANSSCPENVCSDVTEMEQTGTNVAIHTNEGIGFDDIVMDDNSNRVRMDPAFLSTSGSEISSTGTLCQTHSFDSIEVSVPGSLGSQSSTSFANGDRVRPSIPCQVDFSGLSSGIDIEVEVKMDNLSLEELGNTMLEGGNVVEDDNTYVAALYGNEDVYPTSSSQSVASDFDHSSKEIFSSQKPQFPLSSGEALDDLSPSLDFEGAEAEYATYDPSVWSPKDIATATGNEECNILQHHLQLQSTYTEVMVHN